MVEGGGIKEAWIESSEIQLELIRSSILQHTAANYFIILHKELEVLVGSKHKNNEKSV